MMPLCAHQWVSGTFPWRERHGCELDLGHAGEPHRCGCGETIEYRHDDDETKAVES